MVNVFPCLTAQNTLVFSRARRERPSLGSELTLGGLFNFGVSGLRTCPVPGHAGSRRRARPSSWPFPSRASLLTHLACDPETPGWTGLWCVSWSRGLLVHARPVITQTFKLETPEKKFPRFITCSLGPLLTVLQKDSRGGVVGVVQVPTIPPCPTL